MPITNAQLLAVRNDMDMKKAAPASTCACICAQVLASVHRSVHRRLRVHWEGVYDFVLVLFPLEIIFLVYTHLFLATKMIFL